MTYDNIHCKFLPQGEIRRIADQFRNDYWPEKTLPVDMERIIEGRLKLDIIPEHICLPDPFLKNDLSGIVVNFDQYMDSSDRYLNRLRFSFAHEIGHLTLHHHVYEMLEFSREEEYLKFMEQLPEEEYGSFEWQANEFAGCLLVPVDKLTDEIEKIYLDIKGNNQLDLLKRFPDDILSRVSRKMSVPFGVSSAVIEKRVVRDNLWPPK